MVRDAATSPPSKRARLIKGELMSGDTQLILQPYKFQRVLGEPQWVRSTADGLSTTEWSVF